MRRLPANTRRVLVAIAIMLTFWAVAIHGLDRSPPIHYDEVVIVTPGFKLFQEGIFGSDLFAGFHGQDQIYLEVPPVYSLLQGLSTHVLGLGVWQMRLSAVIAGLLVLPLTFAVAVAITRRRRVGLLAMALLLIWRWTPGGDEFLASGITLIDVSRIARYDVLVPVFGLAALWLWLRGREASGRPLLDATAGFCAAVAGLANVYGLFWVVALLILYGWEWYLERRRRTIRAMVWFCAFAALPWLAWGALLVSHPAEAAGQFVKHSGRFDLLQPGFYWDSMRREVHRYALGFRQPASYGRVGFWLVVIGIPGALLWLLGRIVRRGDDGARNLLVPTVTIAVLLALLVNFKRYYYLATFVPLAAVAVSWGVNALYRAAGDRQRLALLAVGMVMIVQGIDGVRLSWSMAARAVPPAEFSAQLRDVVPDDGRVMGPITYWLALADRDYRADGLPFLLSNPEGINPVAFDDALEAIRPDYILVTPRLLGDLEVAVNQAENRQEQFWNFIADHRGEPIQRFSDRDGVWVDIYRLHWSSAPAAEAPTPDLP